MEMGKNNEPPEGGYSSGLASMFGRIKTDFLFPPVHIPTDRIVRVSSEKEQFFEDLGLPIKIIFLPGHTDDSMGLLLSDSGIILSGDAAMNTIINAKRHTIWMDDAPEFRRSWAKMLSYHPQMIYPSHGNPFNAQDLRKYKNYLVGRKLIQLK